MMLRQRPPRSALQRFSMISLALATVVLGYYLGNLQQRSPLQDISALVYDKPIPVETSYLPQALATELQDPDRWLIVLPGEQGVACDQLLTHYTQVMNRLAAWPNLQSQLRFALLDLAGQAANANWLAQSWAHSYPIGQADLLKLTQQWGIAPVGNRWCQDVQATTALIGPDAHVYALLPLDKPARMAESVRLIMQHMTPDA